MSDSQPEVDGPLDSRDVEAIQNDDSLIQADKVDLIANQAVAEAVADEPIQRGDEAVRDDEAVEGQFLPGDEPAGGQSGA
jgi:hypothetical protein